MSSPLDPNHEQSHAHGHSHDKALNSSHEHVFLGDDHARNERRTWLVIAITASMMVIEIVAGNVFGSMALTADGWHMSTHAAAMLIAALAYRYARKHLGNPRFTFGTGKLGDLAAFASAIVLALIALLIGWESFLRFQAPVTIDFQEAIIVAVIGLLVNLVCAWLLKDDHHHAHDHGHSHDRSATKDHNLRAAYLHVLADALTSVLAIAALALGSVYDWLWLDPAIGIVGAIVIARWSWGLIRDAGSVLLDYVPEGEDLPEEIDRSSAGKMLRSSICTYGSLARATLARSSPLSLTNLGHLPITGPSLQ